MFVKKITISLFSIIFTVSCALITIGSFFIAPLWAKKDDPHFVLLDGKWNISTGQMAALFLFSVVAILFYLGCCRIFARLSDKGLKIMAAFLFAIILSIETAILILFHGVQPPKVDGGHIYLEALYLLKHGTLLGNEYYLQLYPNNVPITIARYLLYRYAAFGNPDWFLIVDKLAAALFLNIGIFFLWLLAVKTSGRKTGNLLLVFTITWLPLFLYIPYFYTESLAIAFPSMAVYFWYCHSRTGRPVYLFLLGAALAVGCQLRENMVLLLPALLIYMLYTLRLKQTVLRIAFIMLVFLPVTFGAEAYYHHLGYRENATIKAPVTHWLALGLSNEGRYNVADTRLSESLPTQQAKKQADYALIKQRIETRGTSGLLKLWAVKAFRTFSQGDQAYAKYNQRMDHYNAAYRYVYGDQNKVLLFIIQVFHIATLFLLAVSGLTFFRKIRFDVQLLMQICLFGSYLFFIFIWEAEPRYSLLFTPLMIFCAARGLEKMHQFLEAKKWLPAQKRWKLQTAGNWLLVLSLIVLLAVCAKWNEKAFTGTTEKYEDYIVNQQAARGKPVALVDRHHTVTQTFIADKAFDRVAFMPARFHGKAAYRVSLWHKSGGRQKMVFERKFTNHKRKTNGYKAFLLKKALPGENRHYALRVEQLYGPAHARMFLHANGPSGHFEQMDLYGGGQFYQNGKPMAKTDLTFTVSKQITGPHINRHLYRWLFGCAFFMLLLYGLTVLPGGASRKAAKKIREFVDA